MFPISKKRFASWIAAAVIFAEAVFTPAVAGNLENIINEHNEKNSISQEYSPEKILGLKEVDLPLSETGLDVKLYRNIFSMGQDSSGRFGITLAPKKKLAGLDTSMSVSYNLSNTSYEKIFLISVSKNIPFSFLGFNGKIEGKADYGTSNLGIKKNAELNFGLYRSIKSFNIGLESGSNLCEEADYSKIFFSEGFRLGKFSINLGAYSLRTRGVGWKFDDSALYGNLSYRINDDLSFVIESNRKIPIMSEDSAAYLRLELKGKF